MNRWELEYDKWDPKQETLRETLCTLGNGYFACRGADEESKAGELHYPGTYLAGGYNRLSSDIAGRVIENEDLVNWPNWLCLTFKMEGDDDWFSPYDVELLHYRKLLDMKAGILKREIRFRDSKKRETTLICRRIISYHNPHFAAIQWMLKPENWSGQICVRTALDGSVRNQGVARYKDLNNKHLKILDKGKYGEDGIFLVVETNQSRISMAQVSRFRIFEDAQHVASERRTLLEEEQISQELCLQAQQHRPLYLEKTLALYTSRDRAVSEPLIEAKQTIATEERFDELFSKHKMAWSRVWSRFDIKIDAPSNTQLLLRLHIFHVLQSCSPHSIGLDVGVPARGWHGEAYRGHIFWDELFIFPLLNFNMPDLSRSLLLYRFHRLPAARHAAELCGYKGAMFPWQSGSDGREESQVLHLNPKSGKWVADDTYLQRHVNAAIVFNIWQYYEVTEDYYFMRFYGAEMILEVARFLSQLTTFDENLQRYVIRGVVGPDEFHTAYPGSEHPGLDNNAYTNYMTVWVLIHALKSYELLDKFKRKDLLDKLELSVEELTRWHDITKNMFIPFNEQGYIEQFEGYEQLEELDWEHYREKYTNIRRMDRILEAEGDSVNRYKVSKQADVLMLFYLFSAEELQEIFDRLNYSFNPKTIPETINYYVKRTTNGSTLSRLVHSWVEARSNRHASWNHLVEGLNSDFKDAQGGTTAEGIHLGAMAGSIDIIQRCFTGIDIRENILWLNPSLPDPIKSIDFKMYYRSCWLCFTFKHEECHVCFFDGHLHEVRLGFIDKIFHLKKGEEKTFKIKK